MEPIYIKEEKLINRFLETQTFFRDESKNENCVTSHIHIYNAHMYIWVFI